MKEGLFTERSIGEHEEPGITHRDKKVDEYNRVSFHPGRSTLLIKPLVEGGFLKRSGMEQKKYPLIYLPSDVGDIWVWPTDERARRCFESQLSSYTGSFIVDSTGVLTSIARAEKNGWGTPFWGWHPMYKERLVKINLVATSTNKVDLDQVKSMLVEHTRSKKSHWIRRMFGSQERLERLVNSANTWERLFDVLMHDQEPVS
ncbi:MAG: hypothetical protein ABI432_01555 [Flavobacteriales bacterium]